MNEHLMQAMSEALERELPNITKAFPRWGRGVAIIATQVISDAALQSACGMSVTRTHASSCPQAGRVRVGDCNCEPRTFIDITEIRYQ